MAANSDTPAARRGLALLDARIGLAVLVVVSIALRLIVNTKFQAPTILTDELTYSTLARTIAEQGVNLSNGYGIVYPLLLAPSWAIAHAGTEAYTLMKATNAVLVSLTAIPVFLWARRMMSARFALLAAALTLLMPSMAYSGHIMTENAFVLFFTIAVWRLSVAVEKPTVVNQLILLVALAVAFETRAQAAVLVLALPLVIALAILAEEHTGVFSWAGCWKRLVRFWPLALVALLAIAAIALRTLVSDWHWNQLLQAYGATADGQYAAPKVARYFLWHLGEATFALGVIPIAAVLALVGAAVLRRSRSSAERAYLSTVIVVAPLAILQVAAFMSYWAERVSERNMFCVFPMLLVGLALWLEQGLPRTRRTTAIAAAIAGVLALSTPFAFLYQRAPSTETWAVVVPDLLTRKLANGIDDVQVLIVVGVALALMLFGITRANIGMPLIVLAIAGFFLVGQVAAVHTVAKAARDYRNVPSLGPDASWIDESVPQNESVAFIFGSVLGPDTDRVIGWETSFFNRHPITWKTWDTDFRVDPLTGNVTTPVGGEPVLPRFVITPSTRQFVGPVQAGRAAYLLQTPTKPYTIALNANGVYPDAWTGTTATIDLLSPASSCTRASLTMSRSPDTGSTQVSVSTGTLIKGADGTVALVPGAQASTIDVPSGGSASVEVAVPKAPARIQIDSATPYAPSSTGSPDTRQLGVLLRFSCGSLTLS